MSALGAGADTLWQAARDGRSGVKETLFAGIKDQKVTRAASIDAEAFAAHKVHVRPRMQEPVAQLALIAAEEALTQAGLTRGDLGEDTAVVVGSGAGGAATINENYIAFLSGERMDPFAVPKLMTNAAASWISMTYGATGPIYCNSTACSSAGQSIGLAFQMVKAGIAERCITGGTEASLVSGAFRAWEVLRVMTPTLCRPFSKDRNGMVLGDGAGILVIETKDSAQARGAEILAEIVGYGTTGDAGDLLRPDPSGAARSMTQALKAAGIAADEIGYVNAHGTGTVANDVSEAQAMRDVFGPAYARLAVSSTKPIHGHGLGAAGALEAIVTLGALQERLAPPNINFTEEDPKVGFTPVIETARPFDARYAMSNSFAFGGVNASLVFGAA